MTNATRYSGDVSQSRTLTSIRNTFIARETPAQVPSWMWANRSRNSPGFNSWTVRSWPVYCEGQNESRDSNDVRKIRPPSKWNVISRWFSRILQNLIYNTSDRITYFFIFFLYSFTSNFSVNFQRYFNPLPLSDAVRKQQKTFYRIFSVQYRHNSKNITPLETWNLTI